MSPHFDSEEVPGSEMDLVARMSYTEGKSSYDADRNYIDTFDLTDLVVCTLCGCLVHVDFTLTHDLALHPPYDGE